MKNVVLYTYLDDDLEQLEVDGKIVLSQKKISVDDFYNATREFDYEHIFIREEELEQIEDEVNLCVGVEDTSDAYPLDVQDTEIILQVNGKLIDAHFKIKKGLSRKETNMFVKDWLKKLAGSYSLIAQIISVPDELVNIIATPFFEGLILGKIDRNL